MCPVKLNRRSVLHAVAAPVNSASLPNQVLLRGSLPKHTGQAKFRHQAAQEFAAALRATPAPAIRKPRYADRDLLTLYPWGDPHMGMYAWSAETGKDYDLKIAAREHRAAIDTLYARSPNSKIGALLVVGDLVHSDTKQNRTEASGHALDVDTRWSRVMRVTLETIVYAVKGGLQKHRIMIVRICEGNHDPQAAYSIALALAAHFRNEPRVRVDLSPSNFWYYRFGACLFMATHGHTCKTEKLPQIMAADRPKDWGATKFRYAFQGHLHHKFIKELWGAVVEVLRTLAPGDAWSRSHGYRALSEMQAITYHKTHGEMLRVTCPVSMIERRKR